MVVEEGQPGYANTGLGFTRSHITWQLSKHRAFEHAARKQQHDIRMGKGGRGQLTGAGPRLPRIE